MKLKRIAEACLWLPGFAPAEDPIEVLGTIPARSTAEIIPLFQPAKAKAVPKTKPVWPKLEASVFAKLSGEVTKFDANLAAIELMDQLAKEDRAPNADERIQLNRYTGWGGLPQAFNTDQKDAAWIERSKRLKTRLSEQEHRSAEASTPNAHYTSLEVIEAMWAMVQRLGFSGGRILEPAAGIGYFLGAMPAALAETSQVTAIELDDLSARMLQTLYGSFGVTVKQAGFERVPLPESYFDLANSNGPFGNYQVAELKNVGYQNFLIHDYFFAKTLDLLRPGGLLAFITSAGTLDKVDDRVRQYLASKANLLAAIRLPNTAFKKIANTEVTTDILILQKPLSGKTTRGRWMDTIEVPSSSPIHGEEGSVGLYGRKLRSNRYFVDHPQQVIGTLKIGDNGYQKTTICTFTGDFGHALQEQVSRLPEGIYTSPEEDVDSGKVVQLSLTEAHRPGFRVIEGRVYEMSGSQAILYQAPQKALERIAAMVHVRDAARKLVKAQAETGDDILLGNYRLALSITYDQFVARHGFLHAKANRQAFRNDPDLPLLLSLECWNEESQQADKAAIFTRRTVGAFQRITHCNTPEEALLACIAESGRVLAERIGELLGVSGSEAISTLEQSGAVFLDPETQRWETADAYLSGNVRHKLTVAELAGERFAGNVRALAAVIPSDLSPHEIGVRIGSTWIPTGDYEAFLNEVLESSDNQVEFSTTVGTWNVEADWRTRTTVAATQTYGTQRVNAATLFEQALNQTVPTVYDPHPFDENKKVVNQLETIAAREKQQQLKEKFVQWLWSDASRSTRLVRHYNDQFNSVVARQYRSDHLVLPGFSEAYTLHPHQRDAIWRIVASGRNTLLAHVVGAGKTLTMICAGMELRRLGKASKPCYVVPNHMLQQFAAEFLRAYPGANLLLASKDDLQGDRRKRLISRIATGDWDAVLITHASFERLKMGNAFMEEYIRNEIDLIEDAIRAGKQERGNRIVKELARAKKAWEARLEKLTGKEKKDDLLTFEELGVDWLFVDEAHLFKNLWRFTKMTRIAGLPNSSSERSFDMFVKTRHVMEKHKGQAGVVFATGTPVSNSMAELWVMQRYLQQGTLENNQVGMFDTWAGNFGESVTALELSPDGRGYRMQTRFARFVNLPELMSMFGEVADIRTAEMLDLPVPKAVKETVTAPTTPELKAYVQTLVERAEAIRNGEVNPSVDNMLAVTNDGRKAALDMRLVDALAEDAEESKVNRCAHKVQTIWQQTTAFKGTQIIFCDQSTPQADGAFSVYQDLRQKLIGMGVPETEIAFIHDAESDLAKETMFKAVREGRIRILLGSTGKMGVGTNVQTRLVALHHLDAPWRPADVEQREGRIIRQGNLNETVQIFRYVTEGSFDAYIWQTLETKARFIAQVMQGNCGMRSAEDVELAALSYAEVKALASGNPLVLEKAGVDTELVKLSLLKSKWEQQQWLNRQELARLPSHIALSQHCISAIENDLERRREAAEKPFCIQVSGRHYSDRKEAGNALLHAVHGVRRNTEQEIGEFAGFTIAVDSPALLEFSKSLVLKGGIDYLAGQAEMPTGFVKVLENALKRMEEELEKENERLARAEKRMADLQSEIAKPFEKAACLQWLQQRQKEIEAALDLSKGEMTAVEEAEALEAA